MLNFEIYAVGEDARPGYKSVKLGYPLGSKRVNFPDICQDFAVNKDDEGREYFPIPNLFLNGGKGVNCLFTGRAKDAYESICNGYGHALQNCTLFDTGITVIHYLDEEYGEIVRQKTIEEWKDTEFGWGIDGGCPESNNCFVTHVCANLNVLNGRPSKETQSQLMFFENENAAIEKINSLVVDTEIRVNEYLYLASDEAQTDFIDKMFSKPHVEYLLFVTRTIAKDNTNKNNYYKLIPVQVAR